MTTAISTGELCLNCGHNDFVHIDGKCDYSKYGGGTGERALTKELACDCSGFESSTISALPSLSEYLKLELACAEHFGLNPKDIFRVHHETGVGGHAIRVEVVIGAIIFDLEKWVLENLPKANRPEVQKYVEKVLAKQVKVK